MRVIVLVSLVGISFVTGCDIAACPPGSAVSPDGTCAPIPDGGAFPTDGCAETVQFWMDVDGDGVGVGTPRTACSAPVGAALRDGDCDDEDASRHPGRAEVCDLVDQDCDGRADEGMEITSYPDVDGDGEGALAGAYESCSAPFGFVTNATDCDDSCPSCNSHGTEICDRFDNDCDGSIDEGLLVRFYADCDEDGFAAEGAELADACERPLVRGPCPIGNRWTTTAPGPGTTDCNDSLDRAAPGSTYAGADSYVDAAGAPSWDWDCDGVDTPTITSTSGPTTCTWTRLSGGFYYCVASNPYWTSGVPACGSSRTLSTCTSDSSCTQVQITQAQTCR